MKEEERGGRQKEKREKRGTEGRRGADKEIISHTVRQATVFVQSTHLSIVVNTRV